MATTLLDQETAGFVRGFNAYRDPQISRSNPNPEAFRDAWSARMSTAWNKQACPGCSDDLRFALRRSSMSFLQHFLLGKPLERNGQSSALLAASRARSWRAGSTNGKWRTGIEAEWASTELVERQDLPTIEGSAEARAIRPVGRHYDYSVRSRTLAGYGSGAWSPQAAWTLSLGARLESTSYAYDNRMRDGNAAESGQACAFGGCLFSRPADRSDTFRNFAPRFDGTFRASSNDRIFVSVAAGFRPPETSELYRLQRQQNIARLASERVRSIELGWRHEDARLATSLAAFAMRKSAVILRESNGFNVDNGRTRHEGIEYELRWRAFPDLTVSSSGALARHRYDFSRSIDGGEQVIAGRDVDTAPRQQHRLAVDWRPTPSLQAEVEIAVLGPYFLDAANERTYPGHAVANLRASWRLSSAWKATLRLRNLADRRYADRADFAQGDYRYFPAAGRSLYVALEYGRNSGSGTAALDATPPRPDNPVSFSDPRTGE